MTKRINIFFHAPCFDGIASAVLVCDFFEKSFGLVSELRPIGYELRSQWHSLKIEKPFAVLDFLFHPAAQYWADHHETTFIDESYLEQFKKAKNKFFAYDPKADSCTSLISAHLKATFGYDTSSFRMLTDWADKLDTAQFDSPEEAVFPDKPALRVNVALMSDARPEFSKSLVLLLKIRTLEEVAHSMEIKQRYEHYCDRIRQSIGNFRKNSGLWNNIVVYDFDKTSHVFNRYIPFLLFRNAKYAVGLTRDASLIKISAMKNPWMEFEGFPLGSICAQLGGGGHDSVAGIVVNRTNEEEAKIKTMLLIEKIAQTQGMRHNYESNANRRFQLI